MILYWYLECNVLKCLCYTDHADIMTGLYGKSMDQYVLFFLYVYKRTINRFACPNNKRVKIKEIYKTKKWPQNFYWCWKSAKVQQMQIFLFRKHSFELRCYRDFYKFFYKIFQPMHSSFIKNHPGLVQGISQNSGKYFKNVLWAKSNVRDY